MNSDITYEDRVGGRLIELAVGEIYIIKENVKAENIEKFTAIVKSYIDRNLGRDEGWEIIFSRDYTSIKKQEYVGIS